MDNKKRSYSGPRLNTLSEQLEFHKILFGQRVPINLFSLFCEANGFKNVYTIGASISIQFNRYHCLDSSDHDIAELKAFSVFKGIS